MQNLYVFYGCYAKCVYIHFIINTRSLWLWFHSAYVRNKLDFLKSTPWKYMHAHERTVLSSFPVTLILFAAVISCCLYAKFTRIEHFVYFFHSMLFPAGKRSTRIHVNFTCMCLNGYKLWRELSRRMFGLLIILHCEFSGVDFSMQCAAECK